MSGFGSIDWLAGLPPTALRKLEAAATPRDLQVDDVLVRQGGASAFYGVTRGSLRWEEDAPGGAVGELGVGDVFGELAVLSGEGAPATVIAVEPCSVLEVPGLVVARIAHEHPKLQDALLRVARDRQTDRALDEGLRAFLGEDSPAALRNLKARVEVIEYPPGSVLFEKGDVGDCSYLVLSGSLSVVLTNDRGEVMLRDLGPGQHLGELALLLDSKRTATVVAKRAAHVARIHKEDFEASVLGDLVALGALTRTLAERLANRPKGHLSLPRVIGLLPVSGASDPSAVAHSLKEALSRYGSTTLLARASAAENGLSANDTQRLGKFVDALCRRHDFTLLVGDPEDQPWTDAVRDASDLTIVMVGDGDDPDTLDAMLPPRADAPWVPERWLVHMHPPERQLPSPSRRWLDALDPALHLNLRHGASEHVERLARFVAGRAVGLALSGGAARGFGHLGVALGLEDSGIPVDFVSGASAGSLAAVILGQGGEVLERLDGIMERFLAGGSPFGDVTIPVFAVLRSTRIKQALQRGFGDQLIEDLWLPVRVAVTDLGDGTLRSFDRGEAWRIALASGSPPGLTVPVVVDGRLCCDAGVLDNMPLSLLDPRCQVRLASLVGHFPKLTLDGEEFPGPWAALWGRMFSPKRSAARAPNIGQILMAGTAIGGSRTAREAARDAHICFKPDLRPYGVLAFETYPDMIRAARSDTTALLKESDTAARIKDLLAGGPLLS